MGLRLGGKLHPGFGRISGLMAITPLASMATLGLLLAAAPQAWSQSDCQSAFKKWAKLSSTQLRVVPQSESGRGACVPNEAVRQALLDELARTHGLCAESSSPSDQSLQQTWTLLNINRTFIASLAVCHSETAAPEVDWATKSAPAAERPLVTTPPPVPQRPVVAAPPPTPQKPMAAAPPASPPKPLITGPPPVPPCLIISEAKVDSFALINQRCSGHTVLAVIETRGSAGETICKGYAVSKSVAVRSRKDSPPRINHECVLSQGPCNKDRLGSMFPECDW